MSLAFDPVLQLTDDLVVRWSTLTLAVVFTVALGLAGLAGRRARLRADDLLSIVVGAVPGAVVGGRLGYLAIHPEAFSAGSATLLDPAIGGLELGSAVVGGLLTATYVAILLAAPVGRWAHVVAIPVLVAIGGGKLTMVLGGAGQGMPSDAAWAMAYLGPGPWGSLAPELPSHPAQAYEGIGTLVLAMVLGLVVASGGFHRRDGRLLLMGLAGWALIRAAVSLTWRDPIGPPPLPLAGWLAVGIAVGALLAVVIVITVARRRRRGAGAGTVQEPSWPEPESRPRF